MKKWIAAAVATVALVLVPAKAMAASLVEYGLLTALFAALVTALADVEGLDEAAALVIQSAAAELPSERLQLRADALDLLEDVAEDGDPEQQQGAALLATAIVVVSAIDTAVQDPEAVVEAAQEFLEELQDAHDDEDDDDDDDDDDD